jgi:hypothetical protein
MMATREMLGAVSSFILWMAPDALSWCGFGSEASGHGPLAYRVMNAGADASRFAILRPCRRMCRQAVSSPDTSEAAKVDGSGNLYHPPPETWPGP